MTLLRRRLVGCRDRLVGRLGVGDGSAARAPSDSTVTSDATATTS